MTLKTVVYRGGVVTFRIPEHWVENVDPDAGGEFFEDGLTRRRCV